jgi:phytoene synthase
MEAPTPEKTPDRLPASGSSDFADASDHRICRDLHRQYGTTYYYASQLFPARLKPKVHAVYGFVRVPDEWVDNPGTMTAAQQLEKLRVYREQLLAGLDGARPAEPVLRAFCDVAREAAIPVSEPLCFLEAMEMDVRVARYETISDLLGYTRGSAAAVGLMMCHVLEVNLTDDMAIAARNLGDAMQLTNFLRDVGEDYRRGRIYLPREDMAQFGVTDADIDAGRVTDAWRQLMAFEIDRARKLYATTDDAIRRLPVYVRRPVKLARILYSQILDQIEANDFDVFRQRARTTKTQKVRGLAKVMFA